MKQSTKTRLRETRRYLLIGLITAAPLWVTWLVFDFLMTQLSRLGTPWVNAAARALSPAFPGLAGGLQESRFQSLLAALISLALVQRIPLVAAIYGGTKRFFSVAMERPAGVQRAVPIPFPTPEMRAVGFVTRVIDETDSGRKIAAVYVPTSPNPTSGPIELVPLEHCTPTDWTMDEAMSFVITGGATAPARLRFGAPAPAAQAGSATAAA